MLRPCKHCATLLGSTAVNLGPMPTNTSAKSNTISDCFPNWVPCMFHLTTPPPHHPTTQPSAPNQYLWCLVDPPFDIKSHKIQTNKEPRDEESASCMQ